MQANFWQTLQHPIIGLSPMDGVTDSPNRHIQKKYGHPDIIFTEFTSVEGITHGSHSFFKELDFDETQRPIIAQLFGTDPDAFYQATIVVAALGFDGVDINMGCPAKNVAHRGAGAGLIRNPDLATEIIYQTKKATQDWHNGISLQKACPNIKAKFIRKIEEQHLHLPKKYQNRILLPVSVKTRIGYDHNQVETWIPHLIKSNPVAISLHGRTLNQYYSGSADWQAIKQASTFINESGIIFLGNGDIKDINDGKIKASEYSTNGFLIGRACFGNPYIFSEKIAENAKSLPNIAVEHSQLYEKFMSKFEKYSFLPMRKHLAWYISGVNHASKIRSELVQSRSSMEVETILNKYKLI